MGDAFPTALGPDTAWRFEPPPHETIGAKVSEHNTPPDATNAAAVEGIGPATRGNDAPDRDNLTDSDRVMEREKEEFGGIKLGSAFFGWLTAVGMTVLLTAILTAVGVGVGVGPSSVANAATENATTNALTIGLVGSIALAVILFASYYCGGYVAGRMARFSGAKQGIAVWLWAVIVAIVLTIVGLIADGQANLANLTSGLQFPVDGGAMTIGGIVTVLIAIVVTLGGAVLGGLAGMRFHRRVDKVGLGG